MARLEREDGLPRIIVRSLADGAEHAIAFDEEAYALGMSLGLRVRHDDAALHLLVDDDAGRDLRLRHGDARARAAQAPGDAVRAQSGRLRDARASSRRRADGETGAGLDPLSPRHAPRRLGAAAALRLRRLRHLDSGLVLDGAAVAGRPRLRLRHRPHPRRQGEGLPLVHGRQARAEGQHLHATSSPPASTSSARAIRGAAASSPTAARRAAC